MNEFLYWLTNATSAYIIAVDGVYSIIGTYKVEKFLENCEERLSRKSIVQGARKAFGRPIGPASLLCHIYYKHIMGRTREQTIVG